MENAVKTVKQWFLKCRESGQSEFQALLDWRNTPSEGIGTSSAQRFLGTLLPIATSRLHPAFHTEKDAKAQRKQREKQKTQWKGEKTNTHWSDCTNQLAWKVNLECRNLSRIGGPTHL